MNDKATDTSWMDECEPDVQNALTCHVEIDDMSGETYREILATTAAALRTLALQLESGALDTGHHPLKTLKGDEIGTVYLDFYGMMKH